MKQIKLIYASALSATVTVIAITAVTIWADLSPTFKNWLASLTGHHWVTKSLMVVILFPLVWGLVSGFFRREVSSDAVRKSLWALIVITLLGFAAIFGFYVWHYLR